MLKVQYKSMICAIYQHFSMDTVSNILEQGFMMQVHSYTSGYDLCASIHLYRQQHQQNTALLQHAPRRKWRIQQNKARCVVAGSSSCLNSGSHALSIPFCYFPLVNWHTWRIWNGQVQMTSDAQII